MKELIRAEVRVTEDGKYRVTAAACRNDINADYAFGNFVEMNGIAFSGKILDKVREGQKGKGEMLRAEVLDTLVTSLLSQVRSYVLRLIADSKKEEPDFDDGLKISAEDATRMTDNGLKETFDALKNEMFDRSFLKGDEVIHSKYGFNITGQELGEEIEHFIEANINKVSDLQGNQIRRLAASLRDVDKK